MMIKLFLLIILMGLFGCGGSEQEQPSHDSNTPTVLIAPATPVISRPTKPEMTSTPLPPTRPQMTSTPPPSATSTISLPTTTNTIPSHTETPHTTPFTSDEYIIYEHIIQELYITDEIKQLIIRSDTDTDLVDQESLNTQMDYLRRELGSVITEEVISDYRSKNALPQKIAPDLSLAIPVVLLTNAEVEQLFAEDESWQLFRSTYPNAQGIMTLSRVGFNATKSQALVYVANRADLGSGEGFYFLLSKEKEGWKIEHSILAWIF